MAKFYALAVNHFIGRSWWWRRGTYIGKAVVHLVYIVHERPEVYLFVEYRRLIE